MNVGKWVQAVEDFYGIESEADEIEVARYLATRADADGSIRGLSIQALAVAALGGKTTGCFIARGSLKDNGFLVRVGEDPAQQRGQYIARLRLTIPVVA